MLSSTQLSDGSTLRSSTLLELGACPGCGQAGQGIHDRISRCWRQFDFFQFEAWLHADVPRVKCTGCGKTARMPVPWANEGRGFMLLFEVLALSLTQALPVSQAVREMRVGSARL